MPRAVLVSEIRSKLLRPSLNSYYEVKIPLSAGGDRMPFASSLFKTNTKVDDLNLMCYDAVLPGSYFTTSEVNNDFTGVTERFAYRRMYDDRIDLTFYVDAKNYLPIKFFESWMAYISGEDTRSEDGPLPNPKMANYSYRMSYPSTYRADGLKVIVHKKACNKSQNNCTVKKISSVLEQELKVAILKKATLFEKDLAEGNVKSYRKKYGDRKKIFD